jgi:hypothetical protein
VPNDRRRLSRRTALRTAFLATGVVAVPLVATGCEDTPDRSGTPGVTEGPDGTAQPPPSTDPAVVAALTTAATQVKQLALRYGAVTQAFPALGAPLANGVSFHAAHLAKLKALGGIDPPEPGKLPALPKTAAAALADLASREQKLSVTHATAAATVTGEAARLLAMVAAAESQLASTLTKKRATK